MNDRFSAQLRQHLLAAGDERPADGQIAAVVERVAVTAQRLPLMARLTWSRGRIGPFPSAVVRYGLIVLALALATVVAAILVGGSARAPSTVFEGTWTSIDQPDGSTMTLLVGPGLTPKVHFEDDFATGAACVDDVVKRFTADGTGAISGNHLLASFPDGGGCLLRKVPMGDGYYDYNPGTDTLLDGQGLTWERVRGGVAQATQAAAPEPSATQPSATEPLEPDPSATEPLEPDPSPASATPVPECIEFNGGGTYRAGVDSLSLTVTVPDAADKTWIGLRDGFYLERALGCGFGGSARLEASLVRQVYTDACHWAGTGVEVRTAAEAAEALAAQTGYEELLSDFDTTVGGYPARGLFMSIEINFDATKCDDGVLAFWQDAGASPDPGWNVSVFLVDVEGSVLALSASRWAGDQEEVPLAAELHSMVDSLRIEP